LAGTALDSGAAGRLAAAEAGSVNGLDATGCDAFGAAALVAVLATGFVTVFVAALAAVLAAVLDLPAVRAGLFAGV
jgi:hypothetical protein